MEQYIPKAAVVAEIENLLDKSKHHEEYDCAYRDGNNGALYALKCKLDTLEVKYDPLENFKSLQHISRDLKSTLQDWGYAPNLYFFDGMWHVSWISCEEGDGIKDFEGNTPEEAIDKACNWFHSTFCNS